MTQKLILYIYTFLLLVFSDGIFGQKINLKITSKDSIENRFLQIFNYQKKHATREELHTEIRTFSNQLKKAGYFTNSYTVLSEKDTLFLAQFTLGAKTKNAVIKLPSDFKIQHPKINIHKNIVSIPIEELANFLTEITRDLEKKGKSFSEVQLTNIRTKKNTLLADVRINQSKKRTINRIIIKGYEDFSQSHIKYYLKIKKEAAFNQQQLKNISSAIKPLNFVSEIKPPEVLFSKDSTLLYIYLKKEKINSFDGLLNFTSKKNGKGLLLNGHINLKLVNLLHQGEEFELYWNRINNESQELKLLTKIPYFLGSKFSPEISFHIFKQDSTFTSTDFKSLVSYNINNKTSIAFTYTAKNSKDLLQNNTNNTIATFSNYFIGMQFTYRLQKDDAFNNDKFFISVNPSFGKRNSNEIQTSQFKIDIESTFIWELNTRNSIFIRNKTGFLNSDTYLENEIYRIGGFNSIRGFNEQSVLTQQYSFFNTEYRYITSATSYLYSITDFGTVKTTISSNLLGIGAGYHFKIRKTHINLGYVVSKTSISNFNFNNSKFLLKIVNYF